MDSPILQKLLSQLQAGVACRPSWAAVSILLLAVSSLVTRLDFLLQHQEQLLARVALQVFGNLPTAELNPRVTEFCELPWVAFTGNDAAMLIGGHETLCRLSALACSIESRDTRAKRRDAVNVYRALAS